MFGILFAIPSLFFFVNQVHGQNNLGPKKEKEFINFFVQSTELRLHITPYSKDSTFVYSNRISGRKIDEIKKMLNVDTLIDQECIKNKVILSEKERQYINQQLEKMRSHVWPKDFIKDAIQIKGDTINTVLKQSISKQLEFFLKYPHGYSFFSKPIFMRNRTLCIFYTGYNCAKSCYYDQLLILRKEGENWVELIALVGFGL
jgi:hypothetical protein